MRTSRSMTWFFCVGSFRLDINATTFTTFSNSTRYAHRRLRKENPALMKTAFLWDEYHNKYWWFEVFDCARRLSQTGLLIFTFRGQTSQVVVAMIISAISVVLYVNWKPYVKRTDNHLAIISQMAIFFTLFATLLTKVELDKTDNYDQNTVRSCEDEAQRGAKRRGCVALAPRYNMPLSY